MKTIRITSGSVSLLAELNDSPTAQKVWAALPIEARVQTWGDEIYFTIPVQADAELDARAIMAVGELAYWPTGSAFCIFFGPTPASSDDQPVAASPVNIMGTALDDATVCRAIKAGDAVKIEQVAATEG